MENYLVIDFIYTTINRLALGFMCFIPFWDSLRVKKRYVIIFLPLCILTINYITVFNDIDELLNMFTFIVFTGTIFVIVVNSSLGKKAFVFMIVLNYSSILFSIIIYFSVSLFREHFTEYYNKQELILLIIGLAITYPIFARLIYTRIKPILFQPSPSSIWRLMWVVPATFTISMEFMYLVSDDDLRGSLQFLIASLAMLLGAVTVYYYLVRLFEGLKNSANLEGRMYMTEIQLARQHEQYDMIQTNIDLMRRAKHDIHHHLNVLNGLAEKNDIDTLKSYLGNYIDSIPLDDDRWCENRAVDAIISHFHAIAVSLDIHVQIDVDVPESNDSEYDSDLSIIFGNLLENAIDATKNLDGATCDRSISLTCKLKNKYLVVNVVNPFDGTWKKSGDMFLSTKHEGYGIGTESIKSVVHKYGGTTEFSIDNNIFKASVILEASEPLTGL